jgi:hypothetical protein
MQDAYLVEDDGTETAVADLPTWLIHDLIKDGIEPISAVTEDEFLERLRIELVVRDQAVMRITGLDFAATWVDPMPDSEERVLVAPVQPGTTADILADRFAFAITCGMWPAWFSQPMARDLVRRYCHEVDLVKAMEYVTERANAYLYLKLER